MDEHTELSAESADTVSNKLRSTEEHLAAKLHNVDFVV